MVKDGKILFLSTLNNILSANSARLTGQHDNDATMNPDTTILPAGFVIELCCRISKSLNKPYGLQDCITNGLTGQHDNDATMNPDTTILPAGFVIEVFLNMLAW
ncbi:hypothetical protein ACS0TY_023021 [Phlomoides rotata]